MLFLSCTVVEILLWIPLLLLTHPSLTLIGLPWYSYTKPVSFLMPKPNQCQLDLSPTWLQLALTWTKIISWDRGSYSWVSSQLFCFCLLMFRFFHAVWKEQVRSAEKTNIILVYVRIHVIKNRFLFTPLPSGKRNRGFVLPYHQTTFKIDGFFWSYVAFRDFDSIFLPPWRGKMTLPNKWRQKNNWRLHINCVC